MTEFMTGGEPSALLAADPVRIDTSDPDLQRVMAALAAGGQQVYVVGGAVRNALLGQPIADWDLSSDAPPARVMELAAAAGLKTVPTGIDHGTITVISGGKPFEVTTFRHDVETDGRHARVAFSDNLADDAQRRDFTMNALYADQTGRVIDPVGGLKDLAALRLRFVGHAPARIREDYLRILRFFRFLAWYGDAQTADPAALSACADGAAGLAQISAERVGAEMRKLLGAADPAPALALMEETGVLAQILPGASAARLPALIAVERLTETAPHWLRRLARIGGADAARALRLSRTEASYLEQITSLAQMPLPEIAYRHGADLAHDLALLHWAAGSSPAPEWQDQIAHAARQKLPLNATDLLPELQGPALGKGLKAAEQEWIDSGFAIPRADLIRIARQATDPNGKN